MKKFSIVIVALIASQVTQAGEITVFGNCSKKVKPDRASLNFTSEVLAPTGAEAQKKVNVIYDDVRNAIKKLNLKDQQLETSNLSVYEEIVWENQKARAKGFKATASISLTSSEIERIGEAIPVALKSGAKSFGGLSFHLSDTLYKRSYSDCLSEALGDAKEKAQKLLASQNKKLSELEEVIEGRQTLSEPPSLRMMSKSMQLEGMAATSAPQLETSDLSINVAITARFKF